MVSFPRPYQQKWVWFLLMCEQLAGDQIDFFLKRKTIISFQTVKYAIDTWKSW